MYMTPSPYFALGSIGTYLSIPYLLFDFFFYSKSIIHLLFVNNRIHVIFFMILLIQWFTRLQAICCSFEFKIKNKELNT